MRQQTQHQQQQPQTQQSAGQWNDWVSKQNTQTQPQKPHQQSHKPTQQAPWQAMENLDIQNGKVINTQHSIKKLFLFFDFLKICGIQ